jgi:hypothetical protein
MNLGGTRRAGGLGHIGGWEWSREKKEKESNEGKGIP